VKEPLPMDPEVLADLQLRASSQYDSSRARAPMRPFANPETVERWPCRRPGCSTMVDVTEDAVDRVVQFSAQLEREGQSVIAGRHPRKRPNEYKPEDYRPLDATAIVFCGECTAVLKESGAAKRRTEVDRMAPLIVELRTDPGPNPHREYEIVKQLREWKHPDVDGLVAAIRERRSSKGKQKGRTA